MCTSLNFVLDATTLRHAKATIDNGILSGSITRDGSFVMCVLPVIPARYLLTASNSPDVPDGIHILAISSHDYAFDQVRNC